MTAKNTITELTYELAHEFLDANYETGVLIWKKRDRDHFKNNRSFNSWNTRFSHKRASSIATVRGGKKYYQIIINNKNYRVHRILWIMKYGEWPEQIDHINGNGLDNRICNLRNVTNSENAKNIKKSKNNKSGIAGVCWDISRNKWISQIQINNKNINLGRFSDFFLACCARKAAERKYNFHPNHGTDRPL